MAKIAIVIYSSFGHVLKLAESEAEGARSAGAQVELFQLPPSSENDASGQTDYPLITPEKLQEFDGVLFGIPSRFGTHPYAFKEFFDSTGKKWAEGAYYGKYAGFFVSTGTPGGGQEAVVFNSLSTVVHHGFIYVPLGFNKTFELASNLETNHGGSAWGAGTFAGPTGAREPNENELKIASIQGRTFAEVVGRATQSGSSEASKSNEQSANEPSGTNVQKAEPSVDQNTQHKPSTVTTNLTETAGDKNQAPIKSDMEPVADRAVTSGEPLEKELEPVVKRANKLNSCCKCM